MFLYTQTLCKHVGCMQLYCRGKPLGTVVHYQKALSFHIARNVSVQTIIDMLHFLGHLPVSFLFLGVQHVDVITAT